MKKIIVGIVIGLGLGALGMWTVQHEHGGAEAGKGEAAAKPAEKPKENPLHLPPDKRTAAGITLAKPVEKTVQPDVSAFGRVLDPAPLVATVAEVEVARTALATSEKELQRVQKLFAAGGNASAQAVELAEAAVARDRTAQAAAKARLLAGWGREIASGSDLRTVTAALESGRSLLRLDVLPGETPAEPLKVVQVGLAGTGETFEAEVIGVASTADPQLQGLSFLALSRGRTLPVGAALRATLAGRGEPQKMLTVPRSAIVYHQGSAWLYVLGEEDTFERKLVAPGRSLGDAVTLAGGVDDDEQVVVTGAQQLLAAELQAGGAPEES